MSSMAWTMDGSPCPMLLVEAVRQVLTPSPFSRGGGWLTLSSIVIRQQIADTCCSDLVMAPPVLRMAGDRSHLVGVLWRAMPVPMLCFCERGSVCSGEPCPRPECKSKRCGGLISWRAMSW